jgi:hypothetical protein
MGLNPTVIPQITSKFLECICFEEYTSSLPFLVEFKSLIIPQRISKDNLIGYIISIKRIFNANVMYFDSNYYHNSDYNDFSALIEYYKNNNDNPLIGYLCFYFYANKEQYDNDLGILSDMLFEYINNMEYYDSLLSLLLGENVWNYNCVYKAYNIETAYYVVENIIVPKLLMKGKGLKKYGL